MRAPRLTRDDARPTDLEVVQPLNHARQIAVAELMASRLVCILGHVTPLPLNAGQAKVGVLQRRGERIKDSKATYV